MAMQLAATEHDQTNDDTESESDLLELLGDEYTRRVLRAVTEQPRSGNEVVDAADVSKATAYRRLDRLEAAGLVRSEMVFDPDGHHHEQFHAVVESIAVEFGTDGVSITVEAAAEENTEPPGRH
jgi:predicted transcriptional regulator